MLARAVTGARRGEARELRARTERDERVIAIVDSLPRGLALGRVARIGRMEGKLLRQLANPGRSYRGMPRNIEELGVDTVARLREWVALGYTEEWRTGSKMADAV